MIMLNYMSKLSKCHCFGNVLRKSYPKQTLLALNTEQREFNPHQIRFYAARKGKREKLKREKKAHKLEDVKKELMPAARWTKAAKVQLATRLRTNMFHNERNPIDDVWITLFNRRQVFPIREVIEMHRESHHPTMFNQPDAPLYLSLELDMRLEKKTKFLDKFSEVIQLPHYFDDNSHKTILAFCKTESDQQIAYDAGADLAGGLRLIKQIQAGEIILSEFRYIVCHPDMIHEMGSMRGLLKKNFPSIAKGSLGPDMKSLVTKFKTGLEYKAEKDSIQHDFGWIDVPVGPLSMDADHLEANIGCTVASVCKYRPVKLGPFISIALLFSPPSKERIAIDISKYMPAIPKEEVEDEEKAESVA